MLDARRVLGGDTATEELTLPGFRHDTCSTAHNLIQASPTLRDDELRLLADYGLEYLHPDPVVHIPFPDGTSLTQWRDLDRTCEELAQFSRRDADAFRRMIERVRRGEGRLRRRTGTRPSAGRRRSRIGSLSSPTGSLAAPSRR